MKRQSHFLKIVSIMAGLFFSLFSHAVWAETVCAGSVPTGWIKINDSWSPSTCGSPPSTVRNVWTIARYNNKAVGATMDVCTGPVPDGWAIVGTRSSLSTCMSPAVSKNIMTIRRFN